VSGERQGYYADFCSLATLAQTYTHGFFHAGTYSSFRGRTHGRPLDRTLIPASALLAYTCNHDQIGNRALGDRPSAYLTDGQLAVKAALVLCSPYTPMLFMGEEWGARTPFQFFTSHTDPALGAATAAGRKAEFAEHGWSTGEVPDPQDPRTFLDSKLDWKTADSTLLTCYRALIALRRTRSELTDPWLEQVRVDYDETARWLIVHRGRLRLLCNLSAEPVGIPVTGTEVLSWEPPSRHPEHTVVPPHSFTILETDQTARS
ncbi:DUF3459 domain-containing protein, partial [Streptomyces roseolus]|uniref:DUF3459 domain-containing protein n=1 Tax=Streptomyces roseolus TaxID=67358 RepID=UPI00365BCBB9